ncbi:PhzF family phenazine biosynthesis protein [Oerskovia sp. M15]
MAAFARWTNLSETTFLLPPTVEGATAGADYRLRIFTPAGELSFAGHPTLGSCHAWLAAGGTPHEPGVVVQECGIGLVPCAAPRRRAAGPTAEPPGRSPRVRGPDLLTDEPIDLATLATITRALGLDERDVVDHRFLDNGPGWRVLLLGSAEKVLGWTPTSRASATWRSASSGRTRGPVPRRRRGRDSVRRPRRGSDRGARLRARHGHPEDPVTGSLNAVVGQWLTPGACCPGRTSRARGPRSGGRARPRDARAGRDRVGRRGRRDLHRGDGADLTPALVVAARGPPRRTA